MKRFYLMILALVCWLGACSSNDLERAYLSGLEPCGATAGEDSGGSGGSAGTSTGGNAGSGGSGEAGSAGAAGSPETCGIDDPVAIAQAAGLTVKLYYIADDPELSGLTSVGVWPERLFGHDLIAKGTATGPVVEAYSPSRLESDSTLGNVATITGDGIDDRLIENTWNGPGKPALTNQWGFVQLGVKYVTWKRASQGWGSQQLPTRGVHSGEWRGWRQDVGGTPIQLFDFADDGEWTRTIHQFTGSPADWGCAGNLCKQTTYSKGTGVGDSQSRAMFGCNNIHWDPVPDGGNQPPPALQHDEGNCFINEGRYAILHWSGFLDKSLYTLWDEWLKCRVGAANIALE